MIWATRGYAWGFRFLRNGGFSDPLVEYDNAFSGLQDEEEVCRQLHGRTVLRFKDPENRRDRAGRIIPHEFVIDGRLADQISSVDDFLDRIWPSLADEYNAAYGQPKAPPTK